MNQRFDNLTFSVQTFGCQMNKHDSERIAGLIESCGALRVDEIKEADIVIFMTCCVRESAETKLFGHVNSMKNIPVRQGSALGKRFVAVGGCIGQRDGASLREKTPGVDVVFGTNNIDELPELLLRAIEDGEYAVNTRESSERFSTDLPTDREHSWTAWLPVTTGCDNFCTYCIVPYVRGREKSRPIESVVNEARRYVSEGVREITLLGQNVNSYGRDIYGEPRFAQLLDEVDAVGIERLRFATSHPKDLTDEVIERFGKLRSLMPALHLPVQSGSNAVLERMNRHYTREHYLKLVEKLRSACPDIALSTDVIVGFPGETEEDFQHTYDLIESVGYHQVFTFIYSPRSGTPAASYDGAVPRDVIQDRFDRLFSLVEEKAYEANVQESGNVVPVLVEGPSKRDSSILTGRSPKNINVHARIPDAKSISSLVGTIVNVRITEPRTWYLFGEVVR